MALCAGSLLLSGGMRAGPQPSHPEPGPPLVITIQVSPSLSFLPIPEFQKLLFPRVEQLRKEAQMVPGTLELTRPLVAFEV